MAIKFETFNPKTHRLKLLLYWDQKKWKTTLAYTAPNPLWLCSEQGLLSVAEKASVTGNFPKYRKIETLTDLKEIYAELRDDKDHQFDTIIIDSLSEIAKVIKDNLTNCGESKMTIQLRGNYAEEVMQTIRQIVNLDYHVIVIVHSKEMTDDSGNVVFYNIAVDWAAKNEIPRYFDTIAYCYIDKDWVYRVNIAGNNKTICGDRSNKIPKENTPLDIGEWIKAISTIWNGTMTKEKKKAEPKKVAETPVEEEVTPMLEQDMELDRLNREAWTLEIQINTSKTYLALQSTEKEKLEQRAMDIKIQIDKTDIFTPEQKKAYHKFIELTLEKLNK